MAKGRFDLEAADWDSRPYLHAVSAQALDAILEHVPGLKENDAVEALEIGCGTGILSLMLAPHVKSLTAVDSSTGMIKMLENKLEAQEEIKNVRAVAALIEDPDDRILQGPEPGDKPKRFDLIACHLTLHHIPSMLPFFKLLFELLAPGGYVALTDYEDFGEAGKKFHAQSKWHDVERHGIEKSEVERIMHDAGLANVNVVRAFETDKAVEECQGAGRYNFPFLLMLGMREA